MKRKNLFVYLKSAKLLRLILFSSAVFAVSFFIMQDLPAENYQAKTVFNRSGNKIKVIWREDVYDPSVKGSVNVIKIDENYFANISGPEKAVLGYLASIIGNECYAESGRQNVKCKILSALNMDYQCSESNKSFLVNWFRDDAAIVNHLENCHPTLPAVIEKTFEEVKIMTEENAVKVELRGLKLNIKENSSSRWSESMEFKIDGDKLSLVERTKKQK